MKAGKGLKLMVLLNGKTIAELVDINMGVINVIATELFLILVGISYG